MDGTAGVHPRTSMWLGMCTPGSPLTPYVQKSCGGLHQGTLRVQGGRMGGPVGRAIMPRGRFGAQPHVAYVHIKRGPLGRPPPPRPPWTHACMHALCTHARTCMQASCQHAHAVTCCDMHADGLAPGLPHARAGGVCVPRAGRTGKQGAGRAGGRARLPCCCAAPRALARPFGPGGIGR